jgi:uncharacterized protein YndB with AHSA1/START domain
MPRRALLLPILLLTASPALADRVLITEGVIDAPPDAVWKLVTTKEGWESCMVPVADVDFRVGGTIRTNYDPAKGVGGEGTITHHILAYEPGRVLVTRFDAPPGAKKAILAQQTGCMIRLEPTPDGRTHFVESMSGFGDGPDWDESYAFFKQGNEWTLDKIKRHFAKPDGAAPSAPESADGDKVLALMAHFVGGEWVHEDVLPDGGVFRTRKRFEFAPDGKSLIARGWLGNAKGMFAHGCTLIYKDPANGKASFLDLSEQGVVTRGTIRAEGENEIVWDWTGITPDGKPTHYDVRFVMTGPDEHSGTTTKVGADKPMVSLTAHRVASTPLKYLELAGGTMATSTDAAMMDPALFVASGPIAPGVDTHATINATPHDVFNAWATPEGMKAALAAEASIDLRIGGPFELYFGRAAGAPVGEQGSEGCRILAYIPDEMFCFSWNAPPKFPAERQRRTWVVVTLTPEGPNKTNLRLRHFGFGEGGHWPDVRDYFKSAWEKVLGAMQARFTPEH